MTTNVLADGAINPRSINWSRSSGLQGSAALICRRHIVVHGFVGAPKMDPFYRTERSRN
jgi:hypothetical protein